jgi:predicted metal-dependent phosphoesterase TrpH
MKGEEEHTSKKRKQIAESKEKTREQRAESREQRLCQHIIELVAESILQRREADRREPKEGKRTESSIL